MLCPMRHESWLGSWCAGSDLLQAHSVRLCPRFLLVRQFESLLASVVAGVGDGTPCRICNGRLGQEGAEKRIQVRR